MAGPAKNRLMPTAAWTRESHPAHPFCCSRLLRLSDAVSAACRRPALEGRSLRALAFFLYAATLAVAGGVGLARLPRHRRDAEGPEAVSQPSPLTVRAALRMPAFRAAAAANLADNWADAKSIYDTARELKVPLMAGSSVPGTWRHPPADVARDARLAEVVALTYGVTQLFGSGAAGPVVVSVALVLLLISALARRVAGGRTLTAEG